MKATRLLPLVILTTATTSAEVVRVDIESAGSIADGKSFASGRPT
jgi:hypothetical protein